MTKKELMKLSQRELFKTCRNQGLNCSGSKSDMADRLLEAHPEPEAPASEPEPEPEPEPAPGPAAEGAPEPVAEGIPEPAPEES